MMNKIYGYGNYLDEETIALRFMRNATEQYLELMLSIPEFDFGHPVYYNEYGMLKPIYSYPSQPKYNTASTGQKTTPVAQSGQKDLTNQKANEQEAMEETSFEEIKREINDELRKDPDFLGFTNRDIQNLGIAIASQIAVGKAVSMGAKKTGKFLAKRGFSKSVATASKFLGKKIAVKTVAKTVAKPISLPLKYAAKGTMKVIGKFGTRIGFKMGMISARTIAKKAFTKVAAKVGVKTGSKIAAKTGAKIAASATTKAAAKSGMGPVGWAMMAFDVVSIGLDLGDAGGYMMLDQYRAIRDNIKKEITKNFKNAGVVYPYTIGPLDKYRERSTTEYVDMLYKAQVEILKKDKKYENLVKSKLLPKYNSNDDKYADILLKLSDKDKKQLENIATKNMCKTVGGDVYKGLCIFEDFYEKEKQKRLNKLLSPDGKYMKPLISKYTTWMSSNPNATQSQSESKFDQLFNSMINMDKI